MKNGTDIFISIVVPVFNREKYLEETIQSVIKQSHPNWELILVDDGSSDQSISICKKYVSTDNRIRFFERKENPKGASTCRNIGIWESKHDWIIFLDSDDLLASWCLKQRIEKICLEEKVPDFLIFPMLYFNTQIDDLMILQNIQTAVHPLDRFLQRENVWLMSSVIWSKKFLVTIGGYRKEAMSFQDWEINVRALIQTENWIFYDTIVPDNFYRQHVETVSASRFSTAHISNNLDTFIACFGTLKNSEKFNEQRRIYFGSLIFEWMKRFSGVPMLKTERNRLRSDYAMKSVKSGVLTEMEAKNILKYLRITGNPITMRFPFLASFWNSMNKKKLPSIYFKTIQKNQGKHSYKGKLAFN